MSWLRSPRPPRSSGRRTSSLLSAAVVACGVTAAALLIPGAAHAAVPAQISGVGSARCIDVPRSDPANGNQVALWDCNGGANQQVSLSPSGQLTVLGKCLDAQARGRTPGTKVVLWDCNGGANQQWKVSGAEVVGIDSGLCLDAYRKGTTDATPLVIWSCNGGSNQAWTMVDGATGTPSTGTGDSPTGPAVPLALGDKLGAHDPSRIIEDHGSYYFWATGGGWSSSDGTSWKQMPNLFPHGFPSEVTAILPNNSGLWAPDVIWNPTTGVYDMYYAVALWGNTQHSLIGLITSPTLNPDSAGYHWTDRGIVIQQTSTDHFSAIDPMPFFDAQGAMWMSFGSGYSTPTRPQGINIVSLDKDTGLSSDDTTIYTQLSCGCEGSAVDYHAGFYYLFWNTGGCCSGADSTYLIHVARSTSVTGPYTDARNFLASTSDEHGPGQIGFISQNGEDYYSYHYYPDSGGAVMGLGVLNWSADGWPVSSPQ